MTRKISRTILLVGLAVLALSTALFCSALTRHFTERVFQELEAEAELAAQGVSLGGKRYLEGLDSANRLTWIGGDGTVLFDSQANEDAMENHLAREEVQEALAEGHGRSSRLSATLAARTLYVAVALEDGTLLRLASEQSSVGELLLGLVPSLAAILLLTAGPATPLPPRRARAAGPPLMEAGQGADPAHIGAGPGAPGALRHLRGADAPAAPAPQPAGDHRRPDRGAEAAAG